jgi:hypothetical protein
MVASHLIGPASLPQAQLSVLSYNILLPNSVDAWWTYKMYNPPLSADKQYISSWESRRDMLKHRIHLINADVVCLQEVSPTSFIDDFLFMKSLGYDECEMFRKGRFRPATFWKSNKCALAAPPVHKDRTLLTTFVVDGAPWHVLNCHLQAGKQGTRRVRQIMDGIKGVVTLSKKLRSDHFNPKLIVCGDFNGGPECGAVRFLEDGFVDATFREDGDPVTSSKKDLPLASPLMDVATAVDREPPPTLVVPEFIQSMVKDDVDNPELSDAMVERLTRVYNRYAKHNDTMRVQDVEAWLIVINGIVGRGSEFREAAAQMGFVAPPPSEATEEEDPMEDLKKRIQLPQDGVLTLDGFMTVYLKELQQGKFWGIANDLAVLGEPLPDIGTFTARYDRMYCSATLMPTAVLDTICTNACPNESEPSDHLPVAASFCSR